MPFTHHTQSTLATLMPLQYGRCRGSSDITVDRMCIGNKTAFYNLAKNLNICRIFHFYYRLLIFISGIKLATNHSTNRNIIIISFFPPSPLYPPAPAPPRRQTPGRKRPRRPYPRIAAPYPPNCPPPGAPLRPAAATPPPAVLPPHSKERHRPPRCHTAAKPPATPTTPSRPTLRSAPKPRRPILPPTSDIPRRP